mmetsp:Transcript_5506/g.8528  ORF Transcript_5506/g.8528 Transcript_5506/m.8528 type:complete len:460 (+) Transcript_5506:917-2296(+)
MSANADWITPARTLLFPTGILSDSDQQRWSTEAFVFCQKEGLGVILEQRQGGPCGVLAAVQGFIIWYLVFDKALPQLNNVSGQEPDDALVHALTRILLRASPSGDICICTGDSAAMTPNVFSTEAEALSFLGQSIAQYKAPGGVLLFVFSLIGTRGVDIIRSDMDDETSGLTGQFGHCTQELMNLLLSGLASSQVHDGNVDLGGGMMLRGVPKRPPIGYLSHLEALRYCQVGSFYKKPVYPIWVVGSESHYTLIYGTDKTINDESQRQQALSRARRAFKQLDQQENGFVAIEKLSEVLGLLNIQCTESEIASMIEKYEMPGSGIILWTPFWNCVKPMLLPKTDWNCSACTYLNSKDRTSCEMCSTANPNSSNEEHDNGEEETDDEDAKSYNFTHINGIVSTKLGVTNGPTKTPFSITTVPKDLQAPSTHGHGEPIEEVLNCRFIGCVFDWPAGRPSING